MKIEKTKVSVRVTREYRVTDAEPLQAQFRKSEIVPVRVVAEFRDGAWEKLTIFGKRRKKDGALGEQVLDNAYWPNWTREVPADLPEWAKPLTVFEED